MTPTIIILISGLGILLVGVGLIGPRMATALLLLFITLNLEGDRWFLVPAIVIFGGLMLSLCGLCVAHTNDHIDMDQALEATRGLLLIYGIGATAGPLSSGMAIQAFGPKGLLYTTLTSLVLLTVYGAYRLTRREAPAVEDQGDFVAMVRTSPLALDMMPAADPEQESHASQDPGQDVNKLFGCNG